MEHELLLECIINEKTVRARVNPGIVLLDFLRRTERLTGTKEGCREGDCGACTVLLGERSGGSVVYKTVNSCLFPVGDAYGKHVVTIEGLNQPTGLNPVQQALVDDVGTQCGFCTPGFVISLTACCIDFAGGLTETVAETDAQRRRSGTYEDVVRDGVDGNICRCTGHTPIKKAVRRISTYLTRTLNMTAAPLAQLVEHRILPEYFLSIAQRLGELPVRQQEDQSSINGGSILVSGGTDLYVQKAFTMHTISQRRLTTAESGREIGESGGELIIPAEATIEEIRLSGIIGRYFPDVRDQLLLFGSSPIRHRATIAGNIANASPIGDMTCLLMALDALIELQDGTSHRTVPLRKFYSGYKQLDISANEIIRSIRIRIPKSTHRLSFEKVSRRQYLDIASVNTAMAFDLEGTMMLDVSISAGGVGPTMLHCARTSELLSGREMNADVLSAALHEVQREISPISDARGSAGYKRMLLRQLIAAHVMKYFPAAVKKEALA
ncbi:MAG TPA: FAD binding domain-containing protein [Bacteroidota bacterium]|nr:FAD binding domain-containing protein [Bacteroidota bacterium]